MATSVRYVGPFDAVDIPSLDLQVKRGDTFEADADTASSLLASSDFERPKAAKKRARKKPARKAPEPSPVPDTASAVEDTPADADPDTSLED